MLENRQRQRSQVGNGHEGKIGKAFDGCITACSRPKSSRKPRDSTQSPVNGKSTTAATTCAVIPYMRVFVGQRSNLRFRLSAIMR